MNKGKVLETASRQRRRIIQLDLSHVLPMEAAPLIIPATSPTVIPRCKTCNRFMFIFCLPDGIHSGVDILQAWEIRTGGRESGGGGG